jgi:hypothetical protein
MRVQVSDGSGALPVLRADNRRVRFEDSARIADTWSDLEDLFGQPGGGIMFFGSLSLYECAGFREVERPFPTRVPMRRTPCPGRSQLVRRDRSFDRAVRPARERHDLGRPARGPAVDFR